MLGLAIYFQRNSDCGRSHKTERWSGLARAFAVDHVFVIDRVNLPCFQPKFECDFTVVESLFDIEFDGQYVFVDNVSPPNRESFQLQDFIHPKGDALYVIGGDAIGIQDLNNGKETVEEGVWLKIPMATKYSIWAEQAGAVVLADRFMRCQ